MTGFQTQHDPLSNLSFFHGDKHFDIYSWGLDQTWSSRVYTCFSKIFPYDLAFDRLWPSFKFDLDLMEINILTKSHEVWVKTEPSRKYRSFFKTWFSDLVFDLTWPKFGAGLGLSEINILTKFHEMCIKTVPSEVYTWFFLRFDHMT